MTITNRKLALLANVSPSTVSKVFSNSPEISAETAERVRKLAEKYGWTPPKYRKNSTGISRRHAAILVPELTSVYYANQATVAVNALRNAGIEPNIHITGFSQEMLDTLVDNVSADGIVDGILIIHSCVCSKEPDIPTVGFETVLSSNQDYPYDVVFSHAEGYCVRCLIDYLQSIGHTHIAFISETNTSIKLQHFKLAMENRNLKVNDKDIFVSDKRFEEIGYDAILYYLKYAKKHPSFVFPTAFICAYDEVAFGAIHALENAGIRVPDDISVVGMNDIAGAAYSSVPLTTVRTFSEERILLAVRLLVEKMENPNARMKMKIEIPCELVVRDSTAPPRMMPQIPALLNDNSPRNAQDLT